MRAGKTDVVVVGAGIIGLATARSLQRRGLGVTVVDKEPQVGRHQSGRNSGVVHAGLYYPPGSVKAQLCGEGRGLLEEYCTARGIALERCGKVVVATSVSELGRLAELRTRGVRNGLEVHVLDRHGLAEHEPHADGVAALFVPASGVVDFAAVCRALQRDVDADGGRVALGQRVVAVREHDGGVVLDTSDGQIEAAWLVNCAGLHADRLARAAGLTPEVTIVPFRGEYFELAPERDHLVRHLIYPVPDPRFPFLGVHLTRGIDDRVHVGPNAVLALAREGYSWGRIDGADLRAIVRDPRVWRLARRYWRTGLGEVLRSVSRRLLVRQAQRLVPDLRASDLRTGGSGVRAQAVRQDGTLLDDFALVETPRAVHVLNAPSPGATASLALGRWIASRVGEGRRPTG